MLVSCWNFYSFRVCFDKSNNEQTIPMPIFISVHMSVYNNGNTNQELGITKEKIGSYLKNYYILKLCSMTILENVFESTT